MWKLENAHDEFHDIRCRILDIFVALKKKTLSSVSVDGCDHSAVRVATCSRTVCILIYYCALNTYKTHLQNNDYTVFFVCYIHWLMVPRNFSHVLWYL
jgi:hypothetical protein